MIDEDQICIVGLGYVGLTLGIAFANVGIRVYGAEINPIVLKSLSKNEAHFSETGINDVLVEVVSNGYFKFGSSIPQDNQFSFFIITVGTPLGEDGKPRIDMIKNAAQEVASRMNDGSTVILRSTVAVSTTRDIVDPILKKSNKKYSLAMCPERTLEGNALYELRHLPQIIGANEKAVSESCAKLFSNLTEKTIIAKSWEEAEIIKLVDNTSRDLSFAFANEISEICRRFNVDVYNVIEKGQTDYSRTKLSLPGPVGGPCLEKDPHILSFSAKQRGFAPLITEACRKMNESQMSHIYLELINGLSKRNIKNPSFLLAGIAFKGKPETDDLRGSMAIKFLNILKENSYRVHLFDPIVSLEDLKSYSDFVVEDLFRSSRKFDCIVIFNNHSFFESLHYKDLNTLLSEKGLVFDFWNSIKQTEKQDNFFNLGNIFKL